MDPRKNEKIIILIISLIAIFLAVVAYYQQYQIIEIEQKIVEINPSLKTYQNNTELSTQTVHILNVTVSNQSVEIANLKNQIIGNYTEYNTIDFYAYGDSITRATGVEGLNPDGFDCYILQMTNKFLPGSVAGHNSDGSGMDSKWGAANAKYYYKPNMRFFVYMFTNDASLGLPINNTVENYLTIYNVVKENGTTIPIPCIPILTNRSKYYKSYTLKDQIETIYALESALDSRGIFYVNMYDALDSKPFNGHLDDINTTYIPDGIHPNREGHQAMAEFLWSQLSLGFPEDVYGGYGPITTYYEAIFRLETMPHRFAEIGENTSQSIQRLPFVVINKNPNPPRSLMIGIV